VNQKAWKITVQKKKYPQYKTFTSFKSLFPPSLPTSPIPFLSLVPIPSFSGLLFPLHPHKESYG
jgi:hypothetical protein